MSANPHNKLRRTGVLLIDKPVGPSSRAVLDEVTRKLQIGREAGHCGTLDPLASGLLILVCGRATRVQDLFMRSAKVYETTIRLGGRSATDDTEGPIEFHPNPVFPPREILEDHLRGFSGTQMQVPPLRSALRIAGRRAHELARSGESFELKPREVTVHDLKLSRYEAPDIDLQITCSAGTYIRALARDLGERLATGGYVLHLRRCSSGQLDVRAALDPEHVTTHHILSLEETLERYPRVEIRDTDLPLLLSGRSVSIQTQLHADAGVLFAWYRGRVLGRVVRLNEFSVRLDRLIVDPRQDELA